MEINTNCYKCTSCNTEFDDGINCLECKNWSLCKTCCNEIITTCLYMKTPVICGNCDHEFTDIHDDEKTTETSKFEDITSETSETSTISVSKKITLIECVICADTVFKLITCNFCNNTCCEECFQRYLLDSDINPKCMHCSMFLLFEFIVKNTSDEWYSTIYRKYRQNVLFQEEKKVIHTAVDEKEIYTTAKYYYAREPKMVTTKDMWGIEDTYLEELDLTTLNANRCVEDYGKGWVGFDFETNLFTDTRIDTRTKKVNGYDSNVFPCPLMQCLGFVIDSICNICNKDVCNECREQKFRHHTCNSDTIKSIQTLIKGSKGCPKCHIPISKIEGCDQMFCVECKTTFSWNTGRVVNDNEFRHNPHYLDWMEERRKEELITIVALRNIEYNCNEYIKLSDLVSCFSVEAQKTYKNYNNKMPNISNIFSPLKDEAHYMSAFLRIHKNILDVRATAGNHANVRPIDNHKFRVMLLTEDINKTQFKELIEKENYEYNRSLLYCNVYMMVYNSAIILFDNIFAGTHHKVKTKQTKLDFLFDIYCQFQKILEFANNKLDYNKKIFGHDPRFIKFHR